MSRPYCPDPQRNGPPISHSAAQAIAKDTPREVEPHRGRENVRADDGLRPSKPGVPRRMGQPVNEGVRSSGGVRASGGVQIMRGQDDVWASGGVRDRENVRTSGGVREAEHVRAREHVPAREHVRTRREGPQTGRDGVRARVAQNSLGRAAVDRVCPPPSPRPVPPAAARPVSTPVPRGTTTPAREHSAAVSTTSRAPPTSLHPLPPTRIARAYATNQEAQEAAHKRAHASIPSSATASSPQPLRHSPSSSSTMSIRRPTSASHSHAMSSPARETSAIGIPESPFAPLSIPAPHAYPPQPRSIALSYTSRPRYPPHSPAPRTSASSVALVVHEPSSRVRTTSACPSVDDHFKAARQCDQLDVEGSGLASSAG